MGIDRDRSQHQLVFYSGTGERTFSADSYSGCRHPQGRRRRQQLDRNRRLGVRAVRRGGWRQSEIAFTRRPPAPAVATSFGLYRSTDSAAALFAGPGRYGDGRGESILPRRAHCMRAAQHIRRLRVTRLISRPLPARQWNPLPARRPDVPTSTGQDRSRGHPHRPRRTC